MTEQQVYDALKASISPDGQIWKLYFSPSNSYATLVDGQVDITVLTMILNRDAADERSR